MRAHAPFTIFLALAALSLSTGQLHAEPAAKHHHRPHVTTASHATTATKGVRRRARRPVPVQTARLTETIPLRPASALHQPWSPDRPSAAQGFARRDPAPPESGRRPRRYRPYRRRPGHPRPPAPESAGADPCRIHASGRRPSPCRPPLLPPLDRAVPHHALPRLLCPLSHAAAGELRRAHRRVPAASAPPQRQRRARRGRDCIAAISPASAVDIAKHGLTLTRRLRLAPRAISCRSSSRARSTSKRSFSRLAFTSASTRSICRRTLHPGAIPLLRAAPAPPHWPPQSNKKFN